MSLSRVESLVSVIDYIKEREKSDRLENSEVARLELTDREWAERHIGDYTEGDHLAKLSYPQQSNSHGLPKKNRTAQVLLYSEKQTTTFR